MKLSQYTLVESTLNIHNPQNYIIFTGTKMLSSHSGCFDPHCMPCQEGEYQHAFTDKNLCKLHPYCDPSETFDALYVFENIVCVRNQMCHAHRGHRGKICTVKKIKCNYYPLSNFMKLPLGSQSRKLITSYQEDISDYHSS